MPNLRPLRTRLLFRLTVSTLLLLTALSLTQLSSARVQSKPQNAPTCAIKVKLSCASVVETGQPFNCLATISGEGSGTASYSWKVSQGKILTGDTSSNIGAVSDAQGNLNVTVKVAASDCSEEATTSVKVRFNHSILMGEFDRTTIKTQQNHLLQQARETATANQARIVLASPSANNSELIEYSRNYLSGFTNLDVVATCKSNHSAVRVYVVPLNAPNPPIERCQTNQGGPNGISLGRPKIFDNRTLTLMLESLNESLHAIQSQFVDKQALSNAFSFLQGYQARETARSLSILASPIPSLSTDTTKNTGLVNDAGISLPDTTTTKTTTAQSAITPQAPVLDNPAAFNFSPSFGQNPSDLLSDQVNLSYQVFNLRMLLERSLSDRLLDTGDPRRQAVLGFNVTIDPPRTAEDSVAVVEIKLRIPSSNCKSSDCLSLVALMPQEKTYNSAALSSKSNAFGGSAVVKMFQVGYSERRRGQTFYLYRDNDTISYERMNSADPNEIVFGWMFRPVLGRRSVSPGFRQLFAIVALPTQDKLYGDKESPHLNAMVETYWKKYDKGTMTSFLEADRARSGRVRDAMTFGLTKPEIFSDRYRDTAEYKDIAVGPTEDYQNKLTPKLEGVKWRLTGPKTVLVSAQGNNFFTGTQVAINDKAIASTADGLIIKSNQSFDFSTNLDTLASGPGAIIGRYGTAIPLTLDANSNDVPPGTLTIDQIELRQLTAGNRVMKVRIRRVFDPGRPLSLDFFPVDENHVDATPIVSVNGNAVPMPYQLIDGTSRIVESDLAETDEQRAEVLNAIWNIQGPLLSLREKHFANTDAAITEYKQRQSAIAQRANQGSLVQQKMVITREKKVRVKQNPDDPNSEARAQRELALALRKAMSTLVNDLNTLTHQKLERSLFQNIQLGSDAEKILAADQDTNIRAKLNRLLIESAYPDLLKTRIEVTCNVPNSFLTQDGGLVRVTYPFLPSNWSASILHGTTVSDFRVSRINGKSVLVELNSELGFIYDPIGPVYEPTTGFCWSLYIPGTGKIILNTSACQSGGDTSVPLSGNAVSVTLKDSDVPDKILIVSPAGAVTPLDVPKLPKPEPDTPKPIELNQYDAVWIDVARKEKLTVTSVEANEKPLIKLPPKETDKTVRVLIPRSVTEKPGNVDLIVQYSDSSSAIVRLHINAQSHAGGKP